MGTRRATAISLATLAGIALAATLAFGWARGQDATIGPAISADLADAQVTIAAHGTTMRVQAEALIAAAERSTASDREHWLTDGRTMLTYAGRLDALAAMLADQSKLLAGHSTWWTTSGVGLLAPTGRALVEEGRSLTAHADAMAEHARTMEPAASAAGLTPQDTALLRDGAARMRDAATRAMRLGESLERYGDGLTRGLALR